MTNDSTISRNDFEIRYDGWRYFLIVDVPNERCIARLDTKPDANAFLEMYLIFQEQLIDIKQTIDTVIETERTHIGQSVLRQLKEAIE